MKNLLDGKSVMTELYYILCISNLFLLYRLHYVKKITKRKEKDVSLLKGRLDLYSDEWRTAQPETQFKGQMPSLIPTTNKIRKTKMRKIDKNAAAGTGAATCTTQNATGGKTNQSGKKGTPDGEKTKRKRAKPDKVIQRNNTSIE